MFLKFYSKILFPYKWKCCIERNWGSGLKFIVIKINIYSVNYFINKDTESIFSWLKYVVQLIKMK